MPIYEYRCEQCGDFEQSQRISDPPLSRCPKCRRKVRRLISNTSFQLKGSGWYITDYGRAGSKNGGAKDGGGESSGTESSSETKTESKSETKTESKSETKTESKSETKTDSKSESKTDSKAKKKAAAKSAD
jgi:putative FmdB family regulatory protein